MRNILAATYGWGLGDFLVFCYYSISVKKSLNFDNLICIAGKSSPARKAIIELMPEVNKVIWEDEDKFSINDVAKIAWGLDRGKDFNIDERRFYGTSQFFVAGHMPFMPCNHDVYINKAFLEINNSLQDYAVSKLSNFPDFTLDQPFVCMHIRGIRSIYDHPRNIENIDSYIRLVKYIQDRYHIQVVTIGGKSAANMTASTANLSLNGEIDDFLLDLYLIGKCKLFVGTDSGPMVIARGFNKPSVITNLVAYPKTRGVMSLHTSFSNICCSKYIKDTEEASYLSNQAASDHNVLYEGYFANNKNYMLDSTYEDMTQAVDRFFAGDMRLDFKFEGAFSGISDLLNRESLIPENFIKFIN